MRVSRYEIVFLTFVLINTVWAVAASKNHYPMTLEVLSAHMESVPIEDDNNGAPKDCGIQDFSAYCHHSRPALVRNTMVVQDSYGKSFTIACAVELQRSKCALLPVGRKFEARKQKGGIEVVYPDSKGKERKQLYELVADVPVPQSGAETNPGLYAADAMHDTAPEKVKCNFSSTPAGADITIDGRYMGNTPSEIGVTTGTHVIVITLSGFDQWKRELTVTADSAVNVMADLKKAQP